MPAFTWCRGVEPGPRQLSGERRWLPAGHRLPLRAQQHATAGWRRVLQQQRGADAGADGRRGGGHEGDAGCCQVGWAGWYPYQDPPGLLHMLLALCPSGLPPHCVQARPRQRGHASGAGGAVLAAGPGGGGRGGVGVCMHPHHRRLQPVPRPRLGLSHQVRPSTLVRPALDVCGWQSTAQPWCCCRWLC